MINQVTGWMRGDSGVSVIFGAFLLLAILTVFISAFLIYWIPAQQLGKESTENETLFLSVLRFSEKLDDLNVPSSSFSSSFKSQTFPSNVTVLVNENDGRFLFSAPVTLLPESEKVIRTGFSLDDDIFSDLPDDREWFILGSGSALFYNKYEQLPDQIYFIGPSSLLLSQEDGASFIQEPSVFITRGSSNQIFMSLSGFIVQTNNAPVFEKNPTLRYRLIKTVQIHDFVPDVSIRYVSPETPAFQLSSDFYSHRDEAYDTWFLNTREMIQSDYPEIDVYFDSDSMSLCLISSVPIEIDVQIIVIAFEY